MNICNSKAVQIGLREVYQVEVEFVRVSIVFLNIGSFGFHTFNFWTLCISMSTCCNEQIVELIAAC